MKGSRARSAGFYDMDGDGDLDAFINNTEFRRISNGVVVRRYGYDAHTIWYNDGSGQFQDSGQRLDWWGLSAVIFGDVDGDGGVVAITRNRLWLSVAPELAAGDANHDGEFNQLDFVQILQAAKFFDGESATWEEGDWNGDHVFDQRDIIAALATGNYLQGPYVDAALTEPAEQQL